MPPTPKKVAYDHPPVPHSVWQGPSAPGPHGGITFSMLSGFLTCRRRFHVRYVEGLRPAPAFNRAIEYGQMWHVCEEALAAWNLTPQQMAPESELWERPLAVYCDTLCRRYPLQQPEIRGWQRACEAQFPVYVRYWSEHADVVNRTPLFQEHVFDVPYRLPSGRVVRLRGKWDSVDVIGTKKAKCRGCYGQGALYVNGTSSYVGDKAECGQCGGTGQADTPAAVYLQENKTKSEIDEVSLGRQLTMDLQTMIYLVALREHLAAQKKWHDLGPLGKHPLPASLVAGTRYNVVRRPLSGGAGSIRKHKPTKSNPRGETDDEFYARLRGVFEENPAAFFVRYKAEVSASEVAAFERDCLQPLLEQLCHWYDCAVRGHENVALPSWAATWTHPFGVRNILDEGGCTDLDSYLLTGSTIGLVKSYNLFTELQ